MELERAIEKRMGRELRAMGCLWYKFTSPGARGVPDRILIDPHGRLTFVELKTDVGRLSPQQERQIELLRSWGQVVYVIRGEEEAIAFLEQMRKKFGVRKRYRKAGDLR